MDYPKIECPYRRASSVDRFNVGPELVLNVLPAKIVDRGVEGVCLTRDVAGHPGRRRVTAQCGRLRGAGEYYLPRHGMSVDSRDEGSNCFE